MNPLVYVTSHPTSTNIELSVQLPCRQSSNGRTQCFLQKKFTLAHCSDKKKKFSQQMYYKSNSENSYCIHDGHKSDSNKIRYAQPIIQNWIKRSRCSLLTKNNIPKSSAPYNRSTPTNFQVKLIQQSTAPDNRAAIDAPLLRYIIRLKWSHTTCYNLVYRR